MPPPLHGHGAQGQSVQCVSLPYDVVGKCLPDGEYKGERGAEGCHQGDDDPDVLESSQEQQCHHEGHGGGSQGTNLHQQAPVPPVGDGPGDQAQQKEGKHTGRCAHADHQLGTGKLKDEPADRHLLHSRGQGVEHRRGPQKAEVPDAQGDRPVTKSVHDAR